MLSSLYKSNKLLRLVFIITYLLIGCYINDINGQQDFQFDNDDTQVVFTEATDIVESIQNRYYEKEIQKCSTNDEKIYLTFVLRTKAWKEIDEKNKDIAINKLSYFFNVPKKLISVNDLSTNDINNITKLSTERGINQLKLSKTKLGRLEFIIGCNKLFTNGQLIKKSLPEQMRDNLINVVSGLDFGWWVIWKANSRVKRQIGNNFDGSGEIEDEEEYDYNDEEEITEMPSTPPTHGHRHHHGEQNTDHDISDIKSTELIDINNSLLTSSKLLNNNNKKIDTITTSNIQPTIATRSETSIIDEMESQLESDIRKTIENNTKKLKEIDDTDNLGGGGGGGGGSDADDDINKFLNLKEKTNNKLIENNMNIIDKLIDNDDIINIPIYETIPDDVIIEINTKKNLLNNNKLLTTIITDNDENIDNTFIIDDDSDDVNINDKNFIINDNVLTTSTSTTTSTTTVEPQILSTTQTPLSEITLPTISHSSTSLTELLSELTTIIQLPEIIIQTTTEQEIKTTDFITSPSSSSSLSTSLSSSPSSSSTTITNLLFNTDDNNNNNKELIISTTIIPIITTTNIVKIDDLPENIPTERQQMTTEKIVTARQSNNYKFADRTTTDSIHKHKIETTTVDYIEYDDDEYDEGTTIKVPTERSTTPQYILPITTLPPRTTTTEIIQTTTEEYEEPINHAPFIRNRLPKLSFPAGQVKIYYVPIDTFSDVEDGTNLKIELFHENDTTLEANTWIQYNPERRELYALPLEDAVSKWKFRLHATDKGNDKIAENIDAIVQQNKVVRSANHEISIGIKLLERFSYNIDWQMRLINGIVNTLGDYNSSNIVVREIRMSNDRNSATFVYTNISLPRNDDNCPTKQMEDIVKNLDINILTKYVHPSMQINNVAGQLINACKLLIEPTKIVPPHVYQPKSNRYPIVRNPIDRINAIAHQLLIFKVPTDTFFDEDDKVEVTQSLKTINDTDLPEKHWLQFDAKNNEFYGLPKTSDISENQYVLYGTDRGGLKARDVLVVVVSPPIKKDYSVIFEMTLGITYDRFNNSLKQRYFIERIAEIFNDQNTSYIQIRSIRSNHYTGNTVVSFYNTTLYRQQQRCPDDEIELIRNIYVHKDGSIKDKIRNKFGSEYNLLNMTIYPIGTCSGIDTHLNIPDIPIIIQQPKTEAPPAQVKDDYLLTFVLPAVIILAMLLLASIVACVLHRRRLTGKMELGDEEERRSFRSKGIPVIFQDELEEKPEIGNKSPVIMKDEKPPLLPPSYTSTNPDEEEDYGNYVAPPGVTSGGRESRGKSPVTPSYRKPPPYVSP